MLDRTRHAQRAQPYFALVLVAMILAATALASCGGSATPAFQAEPPTSAPAVAAQQKDSHAPAAPPAAAPSAAESSPAGGNRTAGAGVPPPAVAAIDRKIIKNAQLSMTVDSAATGIARVTAISSDVGGYVVGSHTFAEGNATGAQVTINVPVDRFEEALNLVRKVARDITSDTTSSSDVSDQYVDLQARQKNLEATADRIRQFLVKAATVDEALKVNQQLSDVEAQIEQIKGQLNALNARTSFSTITVEMHEPIPTPTPTSSPTPTATPTPVGWHHDQTFNSAVQTQTAILHGLGDILIWLVVVLLPYVIAVALVAAGATWVVKRFAKPVPPRAP